MNIHSLILAFVCLVPLFACDVPSEHTAAATLSAAATTSATASTIQHPPSDKEWHDFIASSHVSTFLESYTTARYPDDTPVTRKFDVKGISPQHLTRLSAFSLATDEEKTHLYPGEIQRILTWIEQHPEPPYVHEKILDYVRTHVARKESLTTKQYIISLYLLSRGMCETEAECIDSSNIFIRVSREALALAQHLVRDEDAGSIDTWSESDCDEFFLYKTPVANFDGPYFGAVLTIIEVLSHSFSMPLFYGHCRAHGLDMSPYEMAKHDIRHHTSIFKPSVTYPKPEHERATACVRGFVMHTLTSVNSVKPETVKSAQRTICALTYLMHEELKGYVFVEGTQLGNSAHKSIEELSDYFTSYMLGKEALPDLEAQNIKYLLKGILSPTEYEIATREIFGTQGAEFTIAKGVSINIEAYCRWQKKGLVEVSDSYDTYVRHVRDTGWTYPHVTRDATPHDAPAAASASSAAAPRA